MDREGIACKSNADRTQHFDFFLRFSDILLGVADFAWIRCIFASHQNFQFLSFVRGARATSSKYP
jgi:hypothetical protein